MKIISNKTWNMKIKSPLQRLYLSHVNAIALHHMAHPTADIYEVERWHLNQGWRAFGYHYWVGFDGTVYEGRGYQNVGAGVAEQNDRIISIGFQGNYQSGLAGIALSPAMPDAQFNAGVDIINWVMEQVPTVKFIAGHKDFMATACPGDTFPLMAMVSRKKQEFQPHDMEKGDTMIYNYVDENMPVWAKATVQKLINKGILKGDENGALGLDNTMLRLLVINDRAELYDD